MRKRRTHYGCVITLLKFHSVKVIIKEITYKSLKNTKKCQFLRTDHRNHVRENCFQGLSGYIMDQKHVQTDQDYQSHQRPDRFGHVYVKILTTLKKLLHPPPQKNSPL